MRIIVSPNGGFPNASAVKAAKIAVHRHFRGIPRENWHYRQNNHDYNGAVTCEGSYLAAAWTGRNHGMPRAPIWLWRRVASIRHNLIREWLLTKMQAFR